MLKPAISPMHKIETGRPARAKPQAPPSRSVSGRPTIREREAQRERGLLWCGAHQSFLPEIQFPAVARQQGGMCQECNARRLKTKREAYKVQAEREQTARIAQQDAYRVRACSSRSELRSQARQLSTPDLVAQVIAQSSNAVETQRAMLESGLWFKQQRFGEEEARRRWRECPETGLEALWVAGRKG